jgi:hypothetical protein
MYGFCVVPTVYSSYFIKQYKPLDLYHGEMLCSVCGMD